MNSGWNYDLTFWTLFLLCVIISPTQTDAKPDKIDQTVVVEAEGNVTLLCNPRQNSTESSLGSDFEWVTGDNDIPIYSNGKLSPFLFENDVDNSSFAIDSNPSGTLILRNIALKNSTFTCIFSTPSTRLSYTYFVQVKEPENYGKNRYWSNSGERIEVNKPGDQVILPCKIRDQQPTTTGVSYVWLSRKFRSNTPEIEVISLNRDILLKNNIKGFQISEDGSLIIPSLIPTWRTYYECHWSNGQHITHYTTWNDYDENDLSQSWIDENIAVELGNDVSLKCHRGGSDFIWIRNNTELLFINERAVKNSKTDNLNVVNSESERLLNIMNFSPSLSGTYTCRLANGVNYRYKVEERKGLKITTYAEDTLGKTVTLDCPTSSSLKSYFVWTRNNDELLFINGHTVGGSNVDNLKIENGGRSLIISNFSYSLGGIYTCNLDTGINSTYNFIVPDEFSGKSSLKKQNFSVDYGTRNIVLPCPFTNKSGANSSYEWFYSPSLVPLSSDNKDNLLFLNQIKFALDSPMDSKYYETNENGSLIILVMRQLQYGKYTCKRSTGEQYIYNLYREYKWINKTILVKRGEANDIRLPCPVNDTRDREYNVIAWNLRLDSLGIFGVLRFVDGKILDSSIMTDSSNNSLDNVKLADDKTSLIISNITSTMIKGNEECMCVLPYSGTVYKYSLTT